MFEQNQTIFPDSVRTAQELEERVAYWHTHETGNTLREFLGISLEEYQLWLTGGDAALLERISRRRTAVRDESARISRLRPRADGSPQ